MTATSAGARRCLTRSPAGEARDDGDDGALGDAKTTARKPSAAAASAAAPQILDAGFLAAAAAGAGREQDRCRSGEKSDGVSENGRRRHARVASACQNRFGMPKPVNFWQTAAMPMADRQRPSDQ